MNTAPVDDNPTPAGQQAFTRRSMLRGLGLVGMSAALAPLIMSGAAPVAAAGPNRAARRAAAGHAARPGPRRLGAAAQATPYVLQASSELSREFFMTSELMIRSGDYVYPFVNPKNGNQVEAIVYANGTLSHLRRDVSGPTGWTFEAIDLQGVFSSVNDVAVAANGTDVYLLVFGWPGGANDGDPAWLTRLDGPASWDQGVTASYDDLGIDGTAEQGVVKGGISRDGTPYFATTFVEGGTTTLGGWLPTGDLVYQPLVYQKFLQQDDLDGVLTDFAVLYDATGTSTTDAPTGFLLTLTSTGLLSVFPQDGLSYNEAAIDTAGAAGVTELMWAYNWPSGTTNLPGYAFQTASGTGFVDQNGTYNTVADVALAASNAVAVWQLNDLYTVNLLDSDGTLQMIQELSSDGTGSWATPIPLVPDLQAVYGVPTDPNQNTLFAVGLDETLSVLSLGASGWTQTQVHQSGEELYDFSAYRVQGTVRDANGTAVMGAQVRISTDRPVGAWTPTGSLPITPDAPLTVTTDVKGEITFSIPSDELDCAMLTLQALDANGNASGSPLLVMADNDVRGFLGGTGPLGDLGTLTGSTLSSATRSDGTTPLFGTLTDAGSANASAQALGQLIKAGTDAQNKTMVAQAFTLVVNGGKPTYTPGAGQARLEGTRLSFSFGHLFDSIGHAIRHGAAKLVQAVVRAAENAAGWLVDLAIQIGDAVVNFTDLAVADMKSAFHVIGGFFATLGADIKEAIDWLKNNVIELVEAAKASAAQFQTWFGDLGDNVTSALNQVEIDTDTWFSTKEAQAHQAISDLKNVVEGTLGGPDLPTPTDTGSSSDQSHLGKDLSYLGTVMNDAPGKWLLDKFLSYLPATDTGPTISADIFQPLVKDLATDWADAMTLSDALFTFISTTMTDAFSTGGNPDKSKLNNTEITTWFTQLDTVVHDGLQLLDALADTLLDLCKAGVALIEAYFTYQYNVVSSMGILGLILEEVGVDLHFSLSEILSWVIAFPAALVARCRGYSALFPATVGGDTRHKALGANPPDGWQVGLGITGAVAQGVWGMADLIGDAQQFYNEDTGKRGEASGIIDYFDILCPLVETVALWPSEPNSDGTTAYPFHGGIATSSNKYLLLPFILWSAVLPSVFGAVAKAGWTKDVSNAGFPSGVQDVAKDYMAPFVQMIAGTANTVMGSIYSSANDAGTVAIVGTVLGNLSFVGAPLATKVMLETTDDVSGLVKLLIDAGGNIGAAVCIAESASLPTP